MRGAESPDERIQVQMRKETSNVEFAALILFFQVGCLKAEICEAVLYTLPDVINFYAFWFFDDFWLFLSIWCNRCRKKSLEFVLECSAGMLVTKPFPGRCCGVAAVSKRLFKAPETVVILMSNLYFWGGLISVLLRWRDQLVVSFLQFRVHCTRFFVNKWRRQCEQVMVSFLFSLVHFFKSCASGEVSLF